MSLFDKIQEIHDREPQAVCPTCNSIRPASNNAVVCAACGSGLAGIGKSHKPVSA